MQLFNKGKKNNWFSKLKSKIKKFYNKKIINNRSNFKFREVIFLMIIVFLFGMIIGGTIMFGKGGFSSNIRDSLNEFAVTYEEILNNYYLDVDSEKLLESGISGMISYLGDPYSTYMNKETADNFNEKVEGEYSGIGAEISYNNETKEVYIHRIFDNSPASKAGLEKDDILLEVDDQNIGDLTTAEIADLVKGKDGTTVKLKIKRGEEEKEILIKRGNVDIESVNTKIYEIDKKKVGYISITIFASNTYEQFKDKLDNLEKDNIDGLIIDVRGNSGGYLSTVTDIISLFTKKDSIIYQLKTKGNVELIKDKTKEYRDYPILVLVNGSSASASEVLTAALKENYGALVIGTKTFGKGKVQKAYSLSNGATIKYTFQEWLTPNGNYIDGAGIIPDEIIAFSYDKEGNDEQITKSLAKMKELMK